MITLLLKTIAYLLLSSSCCVWLCTRLSSVILLYSRAVESYLKDTKVDWSPRQRQDEAERPDGLAPNGTQVFTAGLRAAMASTPSSNRSFVVVKLGVLFCL